MSTASHGLSSPCMVCHRLIRSVPSSAGPRLGPHTFPATRAQCSGAGRLVDNTWEHAVTPLQLPDSVCGKPTGPVKYKDPVKLRGRHRAPCGAVATHLTSYRYKRQDGTAVRRQAVCVEHAADFARQHDLELP